MRGVVSYVAAAVSHCACACGVARVEVCTSVPVALLNYVLGVLVFPCWLVAVFIDIAVSM